MATVNKRVYAPQVSVINGVDAGGEMRAVIQQGYDNIMRSAPGDYAVNVVDRECQFVRGQITSQDWVHMIDLLTGEVGTYTFYERKSGAAASTGYIQHTLTAPVIHRARIAMNQAGYMAVVADFECRAADETATIADMHAITDSQAAPTALTAEMGGWRVATATHGAVSIYHMTAFDFAITAQLLRACNDADVAYTAVDVREDGMQAAGSITIGDSEVTGAKLKAQDLLLAAAGSLVITVVQSAGAANKVITIANVMFGSADRQSDVKSQYTHESLPFDVTNVLATPLTLAGANEIITIEDEVVE